MTSRQCRCGLPVGMDSRAQIDHVLSAAHAARVAKLPPAEQPHNHSDKDWNGQPRVRDGCPACAVVGGRAR